MEKKPVSALDGLKNVEKKLRRLNNATVTLGWRMRTLERLYQLKLVQSMSTIQKEDLDQWNHSLNTILVLIQTIVLGVDVLERETFSNVLTAGKDFKEPRNQENELS